MNQSAITTVPVTVMMAPARVADIARADTRDDCFDALRELVRFNKFDMKFMHSMHTKYVRNDRPLSPGQSELFEKLIHKYRKQMRKLDVSYTDILAKPWKNGLVSPEVLDKQNALTLGTGPDASTTMELYFNFSKTKIEEVRALVYDDAGANLNSGPDTASKSKHNFIWDSTGKKWTGPFNIHLFKSLVHFVNTHKFHIDDAATTLASQLCANGSNDDWSPQCRIVHGRVYISHITESMMSFLTDTDPADTSILAIEQLCKLGLKAPDEYSNFSELMLPSPVVHINCPADVEKISAYLAATGRKAICVMPGYIPTARGYEYLVPFTDSITLINQIQQQTIDIDKLRAAQYNTLIATDPTSLISSQSVVGQLALEVDKVIEVKIGIYKNENLHNPHSG